MKSRAEVRKTITKLSGANKCSICGGISPDVIKIDFGLFQKKDVCQSCGSIIFSSFSRLK